MRWQAGYHRSLTAILLVSILAIPVQITCREGGSSPEMKADPTHTRETVENPYLAHAEAGARWLISIAEEPSQGTYRWYSSSLKDSDYYLEQSEGAVGIGKFFLQLYNTTGNRTYLDYAIGAGGWIISNAVTVSSDSCKWSHIEGYPYYSVDYYGGNAVIVEYLLILYQVTGDQNFLTYSKKGAQWLMDIAVPVGDGYKWETFEGGNYNMTGWYHGTAGISYVFLELYQETGGTTYLEYCLGGAEWLMNIAMEPAAGEYTWVRVETDKFPMATWCGGTTGIIQLFLLLWEATGNATYLDYAKGGGNWLISQSYAIRPGNVSLYYTNIFCHGDPSCAWIMFWLYNATGIGTYRSYGEMTMNWLISQKEDLTGNRTTWPSLPGGDEYNMGLMMGVSGIGHAFILSHDLIGSDAYKDLALRAANWVGGFAVEVAPGMEKWNYMEKIDSTEEYCTGWYWGVAGIGQFMLEVAPYWERPPGYGIGMRGNTSVIGIEPRSTSIFEFEVENTGDFDLTPELSLTDTPVGWAVVSSFDPSMIAQAEVRKGGISISPPKDANADDNFTFIVTVFCKEDPTVLDSMTITAVMEPVYGLEIITGPMERNISYMENVGLRIEVENTGSMIDDFSISIPSHGAEWQVQFTQNIMQDVGPGTAFDTFVNITLNFPLTPGKVWDLDLSVVSQGDPSVNDSVVLSLCVYEIFGIDVSGGDMTVTTSQMYPAYLNYTVRNKGGREAAVELNVTGMPIDWRIDFRGVTQIPAGDSEIVSVRIVAEASPRSANITLTFTSRDQTEVRNVKVVIDHWFGVDILEDDIIDSSPDSEVGLYTVHVKNTGSDPDLITIGPASEWVPGWDLSIDPLYREVAPGEMMTSTVRIERADWWANYSASIIIEAFSAGNHRMNDTIRIERTIKPRGPHLITNGTVGIHPPGQEAGIRLWLKWDGSFKDDIGLVATSSNGWKTNISQGVKNNTDEGLVRDMEPGEYRPIQLLVSIPRDAFAGNQDNITITATSKKDPMLSVTAIGGIVVMRWCTFRMTVDRENVTVHGSDPAVFNITLENNGNTEYPLVFSLRSMSGPPSGEDFRCFSLYTDGLRNASASLSPDSVLLTNVTTVARLEIRLDPTLLGTRYYQIVGSSETTSTVIYLTVVVEEDIEEEGSEGSEGSIIPWIVFGMIGILLIIVLSVLFVRSRKGSLDKSVDDGGLIQSEDDVWE